MNTEARAQQGAVEIRKIYLILINDFSKKQIEEIEKR